MELRCCPHSAACGGSLLDEDAVAPYVDFLVEHGLDGILALGTTGESVLFDVAERSRVAELFVAAAGGRFQVAVHAAPSRRGTRSRSRSMPHGRRRRGRGDRPPYFALDEDELLAHFEAAANACAPLPFYAYEFGRAADMRPVPVLARLRERAPNLAGIKVSDSP